MGRMVAAEMARRHAGRISSVVYHQVDDLVDLRASGATIAELATMLTSTARQSWHISVAEPVGPLDSAPPTGTSGMAGRGKAQASMVISLGRQVLSIQACSGPYIRRATNQLLSGLVWSQLCSRPSGGSGEK